MCLAGARSEGHEAHCCPTGGTCARQRGAREVRGPKTAPLGRACRKRVIARPWRARAQPRLPRARAQSHSETNPALEYTGPPGVSSAATDGRAARAGRGGSVPVALVAARACRGGAGRAGAQLLARRALWRRRRRHHPCCAGGLCANTYTATLFQSLARVAGCVARAARSAARGPGAAAAGGGDLARSVKKGLPKSHHCHFSGVTLYIIKPQGILAPVRERESYCVLA